MVPVTALSRGRRYLEVTLGEGEVSDGTVATSCPVTFSGDVCREAEKSKNRSSELSSERLFQGNSRSY